VQDVLRPEVVNGVLDSLQKHHPVSDANASLVAQARQGTFVAKSDSGAPAGDRPMLALVRGLAALEKNQPTDAAKAFQQALDSASDFLAAAFYLGAVHAAAGRDGDAVGAWQMSLIAEGGERAYPMLADALIRTGDGPTALDIVNESPVDAWPSGDARTRRLAIAQAMAGQYAAALDNVRGVLKAAPDDLDMLFVAIQVMYRSHSASPLAGDERQQFLDYAQRYERNQGPQSPLVSAWRRYVAR
jgi:predicted TPR repeat methyltransferase